MVQLSTAIQSSNGAVRAVRRIAPNSVPCELCKAFISFRDHRTGEFTLSEWNSHSLQCHGEGQTLTKPSATVFCGLYHQRSLLFNEAFKQKKRRRPKRSEQERIDYFRQDPFVSNFEAFRVLCGLCDKWIRLRPNSTFCSIPWDAHRKSCITKQKEKNGKTRGAETKKIIHSLTPVDEEAKACAIGASNTDRSLCLRWNLARAVSPFHDSASDCNNLHERCSFSLKKLVMIAGCEANRFDTLNTIQTVSTVSVLGRTRLPSLKDLNLEPLPPLNKCLGLRTDDAVKSRFAPYNFSANIMN